MSSDTNAGADTVATSVHTSVAQVVGRDVTSYLICNYICPIRVPIDASEPPQRRQSFAQDP
jgi:hypothetical protein